MIKIRITKLVFWLPIVKVKNKGVLANSYCCYSNVLNQEHDLNGLINDLFYTITLTSIDVVG